MSDKKPKGSGYFAIVCGAIFFAAFAATYRFDFLAIDRDVLLRSWFICVGAILIFWGINRVQTGYSSRIVGQETIGLVLTMVGITIALLGYLNDINPQGE